MGEAVEVQGAGRVRGAGRPGRRRGLAVLVAALVSGLFGSAAALGIRPHPHRPCPARPARRAAPAGALRRLPGHPRAAATVRGWIRRANRRAEHIRITATRLAVELDPPLGPRKPTGTALGDALEVLGVAVAAAIRRLGRIASPWQLVASISAGCSAWHHAPAAADQLRRSRAGLCPLARDTMTSNDNVTISRLASSSRCRPICPICIVTHDVAVVLIQRVAQHFAHVRGGSRIGDLFDQDARSGVDVR